MADRLKNWTLAVVGLTYIVILLGAYTRLRDAGLGCPDWPGCYGALLAPTQSDVLSTIEVSKAWIEMIHRYVAGALGILILLVTFNTIRFKKIFPKVWPLACSILLVVFFQALLGMWTVTLGLYPIVVLAHLLGGFTILALSWLLYLRLAYKPLTIQNSRNLNIFAYLCLIALIIQIALGAWTSANYAALVCADFPKCQGGWWPTMDLTNAFNLTGAGIFDSPGTPLTNTARVTIQMAHRLGALTVTILFSTLYYLLYLRPSARLKKLAVIGVVLLVAQLVLGITNVLAGLPLTISLMHNATAAALLLLTITIIYNLYAKSSVN